MQPRQQEPPDPSDLIAALLAAPRRELAVRHDTHRCRKRRHAVTALQSRKCHRSERTVRCPPQYSIGSATQQGTRLQTIRSVTSGSPAAVRLASPSRPRRTDTPNTLQWSGCDALRFPCARLYRNITRRSAPPRNILSRTVQVVESQPCTPVHSFRSAPSRCEPCRPLSFFLA